MTTQSTGLSTGVEKYIDDTIVNLLSARESVAKRGTPARLREIEITLASLAMALDLEMEGEISEGKRALRKADWRFGFQHADDDEVFEPTCG
jgi:hypothetical protein